MKRNGPSLVWKNSNICRQCILKEKKGFIAKQTETNCDQNNIWDKYFLMIQQKKHDKSRQVWWLKKMAHPWSETFADNIFYRRKRVSLQNRLRRTVTKTIFGTNIFWWYSKKSVTSVDKCDDEKNWPITGLKQLQHFQTMYFKAEKEFHCEGAVTKTIYGTNIFWWYSKEKHDKCRQVWGWKDEKNRPIPCLKQL